MKKNENVREKMKAEQEKRIKEEREHRHAYRHKGSPKIQYPKDPIKRHQIGSPSASGKHTVRLSRRSPTKGIALIGYRGLPSGLHVSHEEHRAFGKVQNIHSPASRTSRAHRIVGGSMYRYSRWDSRL
jgi:hypothetical protein